MNKLTAVFEHLNAEADAPVQITGRMYLCNGNETTTLPFSVYDTGAIRLMAHSLGLRLDDKLDARISDFARGIIASALISEVPCQIIILTEGTHPTMEFALDDNPKREYIVL
jgi:hypothetical protein